MAEIRNRFTGENYIEAVPRARVKFKDYFHMKNLYEMMKDWLMEEGYALPSDADFPERYYMHRETQDAGDEVWIWWRLEKKIKDNTYYKYLMDVDFFILLLRDAEVVNQGQKFKTNWGEVEIIIRSVVLLDYDHKWRKNPFLKHFDRIFHRRIFKHELEAHRMELYRETFRLQETIKTYLGLKTFMPEPELERWPGVKGLGDVQ